MHRGALGSGVASDLPKNDGRAKADCGRKAIQGSDGDSRLTRAEVETCALCIRPGGCNDRPHGAGEQVEMIRSEEHTSELQSLLRISNAVFCLIKKKNKRLNQR